MTLVPLLGSVQGDLGSATVTWTTTVWVRGLSELMVTVTTGLGVVLVGLRVVGSDGRLAACGWEVGGELGVRGEGR